MKETLQSRNTHELVGVWAEKIPPELIKKVHINPKLEEYLPVEFHYLAEEDYWKYEHGVFMSVPHLGNPPKHYAPRFKKQNPQNGTILSYFPTSPFFGRAITTKKVSIPYAEYFIGRNIYQKGVGPSGKFYPNENGVSLRKFGEADDIPLGYYGLGDGLYKELPYSNGYLDVGARSHLTLNNIELHAKETIDYLQREWKNTNIKAYNEAQKVIENKDKLDIVTRLSGSDFRLYQNMDIFTVRALALSASVWLDELDLQPESTNQRRYTRFINQSDITNTLKKIRSYHNISTREHRHLRYFTYGLISTQVEVIANVKEKQLPANYNYLIQKDTDYCLTPCDWEEVSGFSMTRITHEQYLNLVSTYFDKLHQAGFTTLKRSDFYLRSELAELINP